MAKHSPYTRGGGCLTQAEGVTLRDYFEVRLQAMDDALNLARENLNMRMDGFPDQYVKKGDTDVAIAQLAADLKAINETMSELKAAQLSRREFDMQHGVVIDRISILEKGAAQVVGRQGLSTPLVAVLSAFIGAFLGFGLQFLFNAMTHIQKP